MLTACLRYSLAALVIFGTFSSARAYDPLKVATTNPQTIDLTVHDRGRNRDIPIRVYLPVSRKPAPVILFSPGLGGSRTGYAYLGRHWAGRGYVTVVLQHPGSDNHVWQDVPPAQRMSALRAAANLKNFLARARDVPAVLDALTGWDRAASRALRGRMNLSEVGMSGHSFGAWTTEAVSGERYGRLSFTDPRIKAAIALSPSSPRRQSPQQAFSAVRIPWLLMTGTNDNAPIGPSDVASRLKVFPALPPGSKYQVVFKGAKHSDFSDRPLPGEPARNPRYHRAILAISTAFWDAYLDHDRAARAWLDGAGPTSVLKPGDRWSTK